MKAAVAAVLAVSPLAASPAHAEDRRPCVSKVEFQSAPGLITRGVTTRTALERRWDVAGLGVPDPDLTSRKYRGFDYPVCGYSLSEAQVWVIYAHHGQNRRPLADYRWISGTMHGRP